MLIYRCSGNGSSLVFRMTPYCFLSCPIVKHSWDTLEMTTRCLVTLRNSNFFLHSMGLGLGLKVLHPAFTDSLIPGCLSVWWRWGSLLGLWMRIHFYQLDTLVWYLGLCSAIFSRKARERRCGLFWSRDPVTWPVGEGPGRLYWQLQFCSDCTDWSSILGSLPSSVGSRGWSGGGRSLLIPHLLPYCGGGRFPGRLIWRCFSHPPHFPVTFQAALAESLFHANSYNGFVSFHGALPDIITSL